MNKEKIFPLLSINNIYPFINLEKHKSFLIDNYLDYNKESFGAFITVERVIHKLDSYPEEVHGCHGDYEYSFETIKPITLLSKVIKLGSSTAFTDSRRQYYPSLIQDYLANIKVSVMLQPIYHVSNDGLIYLKHNTLKTIKNNLFIKKGTNKNIKKTLKQQTKTIKFTNDKYGLIVLNNNIPQATYLPHVFPSSTTWEEISSNLKRKGNISLNNSISYYAYKTDEISLNLYDFFTSKLLLSLKYLEIVLSIKFNNSGIPIYSISNTGDEIYDESEYVRNCGICSDIIKAVYFIKKYNPLLYSKNLSNFKIIVNQCEKYLVSIYNLYLQSIKSINNSINNYRQSVSFVIVGLIYLSVMKLGNKKTYSIEIKTYCNDIIKNYSKLEKTFEFGECFVAVNTAILLGFYSLNKRILIELFDYIQIIISEINNDLNSIFAINWLIQMFCLIDNIMMLPLLKQLINKLIDIFYTYYDNKIINASIKDNNNLNDKILSLETNYLVVAYEAVLNIIMKNINLTVELNNKLYDILVKLSITLINRKYNDNNGLYKFKDGTIRYDISGHTIVI